MDPHPAFLVLRGLKTLHLRVARQCENALALARHLEGHPKVRRVLYPGLPSHPGHEVARRQMSAFGGMVTLVLGGGLRRRRALLRRPAPRRPRGQPGRRRVAGQPARPHLALRATPTSSSARRASIRAWCASPSASRTRPTSSPTWSRRSPPRKAPCKEDHGERDDPEPGARGPRRLLRGPAPAGLPGLPALPPRAPHGPSHLAGCRAPTSSPGWWRSASSAWP